MGRLEATIASVHLVVSSPKVRSNVPVNTRLCVCHLALSQTLAIYDRFGRLMLGDEQQPKDVLEYLVIERHLVNPYGCWRLHGKIVPSWAPAKDPIIKVRTFCDRLFLENQDRRLASTIQKKKRHARFLAYEIILWTYANLHCRNSKRDY